MKKLYCLYYISDDKVVYVAKDLTFHEAVEWVNKNCDGDDMANGVKIYSRSEWRD